MLNEEGAEGEKERRRRWQVSESGEIERLIGTGSGKNGIAVGSGRRSQRDVVSLRDLRVVHRLERRTTGCVRPICGRRQARFAFGPEQNRLVVPLDPDDVYFDPIVTTHAATA